VSNLKYFDKFNILILRIRNMKSIIKTSLLLILATVTSEALASAGTYFCFHNGGAYDTKYAVYNSNGVLIGDCGTKTAGQSCTVHTDDSIDSAQVKVQYWSVIHGGWDKLYEGSQPGFTTLTASGTTTTAKVEISDPNNPNCFGS
jgi:hypothetical protein